MSRSINAFVFACCVALVSFSVPGCSESNEVIEDTRTQTEIDQEDAAYEAEMEEAESSDVSE